MDLETFLPTHGSTLLLRKTPSTNKMLYSPPNEHSFQPDLTARELKKMAHVASVGTDVLPGNAFLPGIQPSPLYNDSTSQR